MKKGFTLIELLAVIVILAIIALIATPIVLGIINDAKESATLRSAEFYVDGVENAIIKKNLQEGGTFNPERCDVNVDSVVCDGINLDIEIDGEKPKEGFISFSNGKVTNVELQYSNGFITKEDNKFVLNENNNNSSQNVQWIRVNNAKISNMNSDHIRTNGCDLIYGNSANSFSYYNFDNQRLEQVFLGDESITVNALQNVDCQMYLFQTESYQTYYSKKIQGPYYKSNINFDLQILGSYYSYSFDDGYFLGIWESGDDVTTQIYFLNEFGSDFIKIDKPPNSSGGVNYFMDNGKLVSEDYANAEYYCKSSMKSSWEACESEKTFFDNNYCETNKLGNYYYDSDTHSYSDSCSGKSTPIGKVTYNGNEFEYALLKDKLVAYYEKDNGEVLIFYTTQLNDVESYALTE